MALNPSNSSNLEQLAFKGLIIIIIITMLTYSNVNNIQLQTLPSTEL